MQRSIALSLFCSLLLLPATSLAAGAASLDASSDESVTEEILNAIEEEAFPQPMMDGRGGGGGGMGISSILPPPFGGGVQVDATITREVTPDFVAINAYCESGKYPTREAVRDALNQLYSSIKEAIGKDARVRRSGGISAYPVYDGGGQESGSYSGSLNLFIRILKTASAQEISDLVEAKGCSVSWDVRLVDAQEFELSILDSLLTRLNKRKAIFEKLLRKKLTRVISASLSTWVDGYSSYDPERNTADATTTLSVSFDLGGRASIPVRLPSSSTAPKG